jgi:phospholipid transport system substrate-binding protein
MRRLGFLLLLIALVLAAPVPSLAASASDPNGAASATVRNFYVTLTETMKEGPRLGYAGRYRKLNPALQTAFNLPLMTRVAVGPLWNKATPAEQQQLISAFSQFSVANYASQFKSWDGEQFVVTDEKPSAAGDVLVESKLQPKSGEAVQFNYVMRRDEAGNWRIVDVLLAGAISQLAARRSEFDAIAEKDGIPALVNSLDRKSKQMGPS